MRISRLIVVGLIVSINSLSPASALFGLECRESKNVVSQLDKEIDSKEAYILKLQQRQDRYLKFVTLTPAMRQEKYKSCRKPVNGIPFSHEICKGLLTHPSNEFQCTVSQTRCNQVAKEIYDQGLKLDLVRDTRSRVILNNQKCFDPIVVAEAQRLSGK